MSSYLLVVNPESGRGRGRKQAEALRDRLSRSHGVELAETERRGSATDVAAAWASRVRRVIAVGGDGTLNEVLTGLLRSGLPRDQLPELGFLPAGTANAAVRAFGFGTDPARLARALPRATATPVDVGFAGFAGDLERPFLLWFGAGFDAVVIETLNRDRSGPMGVAGLVRSTPRVLDAILRYRAPEIRVAAPGFTEKDLSSVILANVGRIAFGGVVADTADPRDGLLDLVALPAASKWRLPVLGLRMLTSSLHRATRVRYAQVSRVDVTSEGDVPVQLDGEPVGTLPATIRVEPGAIRLLLPRADAAT